MGTSKNELKHFVEIYGGIDNLRTNYPQTYQAYKETVGGSVATRATMQSADKEAPESKFVKVKILHVSYTKDRSHIHVELLADRPESDGTCLMCTEVIGKAGTHLCSSNPDNSFLGNKERASIDIPVDPNNSNPLDDITIDVEVYAVNKKVVTYKNIVLLNNYNIDLVGEFTITSPCNINTEKGSSINIAYLWEHGLTPYDYFYTREQVTGRQGKELCIPSTGKLLITKPIDSVDRIENTELAATVVGRNLRKTHNRAGIREHTETHNADKTFTVEWNLDYKWGFPYKDFLIDTYEYIQYDHTIELSLCNSSMRATFYVTNDPLKQYLENVMVIPKIYIYRDCFLEGTDILLADGTSTKKVEDIKKNDQLQGPDGTPVTVAADTNLMIRDTNIANIEVDGREFKITAHHPFETEQGLLCACLLDTGSIITTKGGTATVTNSCVRPENDCKIYGIALEGEVHRLYANGYLVGDSIAEMDADERIHNLRYSVPAEWRTDYDSWHQR